MINTSTVFQSIVMPVTLMDGGNVKHRFYYEVGHWSERDRWEPDVISGPEFFSAGEAEQDSYMTIAKAEIAYQKHRRKMLQRAANPTWDGVPA